MKGERKEKGENMEVSLVLEPAIQSVETCKSSGTFMHTFNYSPHSLLSPLLSLSTDETGVFQHVLSVLVSSEVNKCVDDNTADENSGAC